ncbi:MAG: DUF2752 domain-containing protein [Desulfobacterales bacterium]
MQVIVNKIVPSYNPTYGYKSKLAIPSKSVRLRFSFWFFTPILAPLLQKPRLIRILTAIGMVQVLLAAMGLRGWQCPLQFTLGVSCPGCGLTTAIVMLLKGNWQLAVQSHAFAPLFLILGIGMLIVGTLPLVYAKKIAAWVAILERNTGITAIVLLGIMLYGLLRHFIIL